MVIDFSAIETGDIVTVRDRAGNRVRGAVYWGSGQLLVEVLGSLVPIARQSRLGNWSVLPNIQFVDHQPTLFGTDA